MEWKVQNALNRDVERQHLNKILKEIEQRISDVRGQASPDEITRIVERVIRAESPDALTSVTVNLTGDVSGQGTTNEFGRVNIDVEIDPSKLGITEAPIDSSYYWRINGTWEQVSDAVSDLQDIEESGVLVYTGGTPAYRSLIVEGVEDEVVVANGDGQDLDLPSISVGLADLENTEEGVGPLKIYTRDSKGRIEGDEDATTDNLPEGAINLYYTKERAQSPVVDLLGLRSVLAYPSVKGSWLETSPTNVNFFLAGSWSRGDELSIHAQNRLALVGGAITLTSRTGTYPVAESFGSVVHVKFISPTLARVWGDLSGTPDSFNLLTEAGDFLMTESGDNLVVL